LEGEKGRGPCDLEPEKRKPIGPRSGKRKGKKKLLPGQHPYHWRGGRREGKVKQLGRPLEEQKVKNSQFRRRKGKAVSPSRGEKGVPIAEKGTNLSLRKKKDETTRSRGGMMGGGEERRSCDRFPRDA